MFEGVVIGYRAWKINAKKCVLCGPVSKVIWPHDRKLEADCVEVFSALKYSNYAEFTRQGEVHLTPGDSCPCGIYGFHTLEDAYHYGINSTSVLGVAAFWGRIVVHTNGFKAQYARILAISDHIQEERELGWANSLDAITERYKIPAIPLDLLEPYGLTFGEPLGIRFEEDFPG